MTNDRMLTTLLRSLQTYTDRQDTPKLVSTAAQLSASLINPLNVTLLIKIFIKSPAIWQRADDLSIPFAVLSAFHSATHLKARQELEWIKAKEDPHNAVFNPLRQDLDQERWVKAVLMGIDDSTSPRWRHLLVLGGLVNGFETAECSPLSDTSRGLLYSALVNATNLALELCHQTKGEGSSSIAMAINQCFQFIPDPERALIEFDNLLPVLMGSFIYSRDGLESAYFLATIDFDLNQSVEKRISWPANSTSQLQIQRMLSKPLVASLGPFSRLISHACEQVGDLSLLHAVMGDLISLSRSIAKHWRRNKLSTVDVSEESTQFTTETLQMSTPTLWRLLRSMLFAVVVILRGIMGRAISDHRLGASSVTPSLATQALDILRDLYFISARLGAASFSQYTFVNLVAIDILSKYPEMANDFLRSIQPLELGHIPADPLERNLDLYFLNTAEHFTLVLPASTNEELLVRAAHPYLAPGGSRHLLQSFEAAHSVMLAILCAPQSSALVAQHLPFYFDCLFQAFPSNLSTRQFRLAFKTLIGVVAPPAPISASQPELSSILMELAHHRALTASQTPLPPSALPPTATADVSTPPLSEQATLCLAMIDSLPSMPLPHLEEWLTLTAQLVNHISTDRMRQASRQRFWEMLNNGEMDVERSQLCVAWWNTRGGRELLLFSYENDNNSALMSGALPAGESAKL